jgi:hypothetical protein
MVFQRCSKILTHIVITMSRVCILCYREHLVLMATAKRLIIILRMLLTTGFHLIAIGLPCPRSPFPPFRRGFPLSDYIVEDAISLVIPFLSLPYILFTSSHPVYFLTSCLLPHILFTSSHPVYFLTTCLLPHILFTSSHPVYFLTSCLLPHILFTSSHPVYFLNQEI